MKNHLIISLLFLSVVVGQQQYNVLSVEVNQEEYIIKNLLKRDGVFVKKFSDDSLNGMVFQMFGDIKVPLGMIKNGKKNGKWSHWYKNGRKKDEGTYKDGKLHGLVISWNLPSKNSFCSLIQINPSSIFS